MVAAICARVRARLRSCSRSSHNGCGQYYRKYQAVSHLICNFLSWCLNYSRLYVPWHLCKRKLHLKNERSSNALSGCPRASSERSRSISLLRPGKVKILWRASAARCTAGAASASRLDSLPCAESKGPILTAARVHAQTPASVTAAAKRQTPPRTPASIGRSALRLCAALLYGSGFGGSYASETILSRAVIYTTPFFSPLNAKPSAQNPVFPAPDRMKSAALCGDCLCAKSVLQVF